VIVAWFAGEDVGPFELFSALDISERLRSLLRPTGRRSERIWE